MAAGSRSESGPGCCSFWCEEALLSILVAGASTTRTRNTAFVRFGITPDDSIISFVQSHIETPSFEKNPCQLAHPAAGIMNAEFYNSPDGNKEYGGPLLRAGIHSAFFVAFVGVSKVPNKIIS